MPKPNLEKFLTDPAFAEDRELFAGYIDHHVTTRAKQAAEKQAAKKPAENIWDKLFGVGAQTDESENIFDRLFR